MTERWTKGHSVASLIPSFLLSKTMFSIPSPTPKLCTEHASDLSGEPPRLLMMYVVRIPTLGTQKRDLNQLIKPVSRDSEDCINRDREGVLTAR